MFLSHQDAFRVAAEPMPAAQTMAVPAGTYFLVWSLRLRGMAAQTPGAMTMLTNGFEHIGWPDGETYLDNLIAATANAFKRPIEVRPHRCRLLSTDEALYARAVALIALGRSDHARAGLPGTDRDVDAMIGVLIDFVVELQLAGLSFGMSHIPAVLPATARRETDAPGLRT